MLTPHQDNNDNEQRQTRALQDTTRLPGPKSLQARVGESMLANGPLVRPTPSCRPPPCFPCNLDPRASRWLHMQMAATQYPPIVRHRLCLKKKEATGREA